MLKKILLFLITVFLFHFLTNCTTTNVLIVNKEYSETPQINTTGNEIQESKPGDSSGTGYEETPVSSNKENTRKMNQENEKVTAVKFPVVKIKTIDNDETYKGKITGLEGDVVYFLPFPYWNIEHIRIPTDDIYSIQLQKERSTVIDGILNGAAFGFIITGIILGSSSKYNTHFEQAFVTAGLTATLGMGTGLVIGLSIDASNEREFVLYNIPGSKKIKIIRKIMGLQ
ncbi:MAG: hypothetical protein JXB88_25005 [Spirochaetales bacterium]|nr:hypothetical protein [Spirochaetales bacterium]